MAVDLTQPISWTTATGDVAEMLEELQPNILKPHVRDHLAVLFLHFGDAADARGFLTGLSELMKSALTHLNETVAHRTGGTPGTPYVGVGLSAAGYRLLGLDDERTPADEAFRRGMKAPGTRAKLADPPSSGWDVSYRDEVHAVVLVGDATDAAASNRRNLVEALLPASASVLGEETGLSQVNADGNGIEHFGYVDGRSQPLFLTEDVDAERDGQDGTSAWDPAFPPEQVLVADPAAPDPAKHFGSYFVFRKLEQNVRRFAEAEEKLTADLGLVGDDAARAGAMLVGRFEDGTPLTTQSADGAQSPVMNNFTYDSDGQGIKCPFQAHIRKTNPRGSGGFEPPENERRHLMARRGQTFGVRADDPAADLPASARPSGGVGLLFMAFNADLNNQFEFTQSLWANNPGFPAVPEGAPAPGLDQVIGQGARPAMSNPVQWGQAGVQQTDAIAQAVRMRGGEYFFMPSLAFLRGLADG